MRFTFEYTTIHLSTAVYKRLMDQTLNTALTHGAALWINTAISCIPVWSGASHGTFLKLAAKIGYAFTVGGGVPWLGGPSYGQARSGAKKTVFDGAYVLEYYTNLWHLVYNEYNNANANPIEGRLFARLLRPGPYHFQDKAALAFRQFSKTVRLPSPMLAISKKTKMVK
jgi:hypothetical protein